MYNCNVEMNVIAFGMLILVFHASISDHVCDTNSQRYRVSQD